MAKKAEENKNNIAPVIIEKGYYESISDSQLLYGDYVNQHRHMPGIYDGLKPSYRRMIYTALKMPDRLVKVSTLTGECGGKYSPHSPDHLNSVVNELVIGGMFDGQGNHGVKNIYEEWNITPAAPRYIEAKISKKWRKLFDPLIDLVEHEESELNHQVAKYIPTPIPLSLLVGSLGLGLGIRSSIPAFSFSSLLKAYKANDPSLLEPSVKIGMNKRVSELKKLWDTGIGRINYNFDMSEYKDNKGNVIGYIINGDPNYIQITLTQRIEGDPSRDIQGWRDKGLVKLADVSDRGKADKLLVTLKPKQKEVTLDMLKAELEASRQINITYKIAVTNGEYTQVIGLYKWIDSSYKEYERLVLKSVSESLAKLDLKEDVVNNSAPVANYILANPKSDVPEIAKSLKLGEPLVSEITKKSISVLMKLDKEKELEDIKEKRKELKALKVEDFYKDLL